MRIIFLLLASALSCIAQEQVWVVNSPNTSTAGKSWGQAVSEGLIDGYSFIEKFGEIESITTSEDPADVWGFGGLYTNSTTADIGQISSTDATDLMAIEVQGLGASTNLITQSVTMNGTNVVSLSTNLLSVFRMINVGSTNVAGVIFASTNGTVVTAGTPADAGVRAQIDNGHNQTMMAIYKIPFGKTGYLWKWKANVLRSGGATAYADFTLRARPEGQVYAVKDNRTAVSGGSSSFESPFPFALSFSAGTDILVRCEEVSATVGVSAGFTILLKDD